MKVGPGSVLAGRFELRTQIGRGGMGSVFQARDLQTKRDVAVKVLTLDGEHDVVRFAREASMLATIQHPNVVQYVAHGDFGGIHYLAQEWVDGTTLSMRLRTQGITPRNAIAIVCGVADALGAAHALGVIHRDVKPSNVILSRTIADQVKLVDFGVARQANEAGVLTRTGVLIGTPQYMSPEQSRGDTYIEPMSDVWSLGCVLYELLSGQLPFNGPTPTAIRAKVLLGEPTPLNELYPDAPAELVALVAEMLAKPTAARPQAGSIVAARLRALPHFPDGPPRKLRASPPTAAMPLRPKRTSGPMAAVVPAGSFVMVTPLEGSSPEPSGHRKILEIASQRGLEAHVLEDGSAVLASRDRGKAGALAATGAALDICDQVFDAAVTVFGQAYEDTLSEAVDRGSLLLERAQMDTMFSGIVKNAEAVIPIDEVIAELIADELPVERREQGPILRTNGRHGHGGS
jgi:serine/threonine protein kinase